MKNRFITLFVALIMMAIVAVAAPVNPQRAMQVAQQFVPMSAGAAQAPSRVDAQPTPTIVYTHPMPKSGHPAFYIVNVDGAFVLVSADDIAHPVLGYSFGSNWPTNEQIPAHVKGFFDDLAVQMETAIEQQVSPDNETSSEWKQGSFANSQFLTTHQSDSVGPLLTTSWNQSPYYNALTPDPEAVVTGCVPTAMAQIIKYWNYPIRGRGIHSYYEDIYGLHSVDFGTTTYDYSNMPNALTPMSTPVQINAVATLMRDCGVAVDLIYGAIGSSSNDLHIYSAFINNFHYSPDIKIVQRWIYNDEEWESLMRNSIDRHEPVCYLGFNLSIGHAWVLDGYNSDGYYHFNFGWGGTADGWYLLSGVTSFNYTSFQTALVNIHPDSTSNTIVTYAGRDRYIVSEPVDFHNLLGLSPCINTQPATYDTVTFVSNDSASQLVLDFLNFSEGNLFIYDGQNTNTLLRSCHVDRLGHNIPPLDFSPVVSSLNALTIIYHNSTTSIFSDGFHLRISKEDSCRMVSNLDASVDSSSISLSWVENGNSTLWEVEYGYKGYKIGESNIVTTDTNTFIINGIEPDSVYEISVRPICDMGGLENRIIVNEKTYWTDVVNTQPLGYSIEANGTIRISSAEGLAWLSKLSWTMDDQYYSFERNRINLDNDIDLDGLLWKPINGWMGDFDGNGHVIYNMSVKETGGTQGGLFRSFDGDTIKNVGFVNASIYAASVGVISDWSGYNCHAINCFSQDHALYGFGYESGGLFGEFNGEMTNCFATGSVLAQNTQGGLIGAGFPNLYNCYSSVASFLDHCAWSGLICGTTTGGTFVNCYVDIDFEKDTWSSHLVGNLYDEQNSEMGYFFGYPENISMIKNVAGFTRRINPIAHTIPDTSLNYQYPSSLDLVTALNLGVMEKNSPLLRTWVWDTITGLPKFGDFFEVTCPNVNNISAKNISHNNGYAVVLSWQENGTAEEWQIKCIQNGQTEDYAYFFNSYTNYDTIQGLNIGETYTFFVRPVCDTANLLTWGAPFIFLVDMPYWDEIVTSQPEGYSEDELGNVNVFSAEGLTWLAICSNRPYGQDRNNFEGKSIRIMSDIDLSGYKWRPISRTYWGNSFSEKYKIDLSFKGNLEGFGHTISNMYCNEDFGEEEYNRYSTGLISYATNACISDLTLNNCHVVGRNTVGSLVGIARDCTIKNCHTNGQIYGIRTVGGVAGGLTSSENGNGCIVHNSSSSGFVYGDYYSGGLIGENGERTTIMNAYSNTNVIRRQKANFGRIGGLVGLSNGIIRNCYSIGVVDSVLTMMGVESGISLGEVTLACDIQNVYALNNVELPFYALFVDSFWTAPNINNTSLFYASGQLETTIAINNSNYNNLLSALNAWVDANNTGGLYRHWMADTAGVNGGFPLFAPMPKYVITFLNSDSSLLQRDTLEYGSMPVYRGKDPVKPNDGEYFFVFTGWKPNIETVTGDATYIATYESHGTGFAIPNETKKPVKIWQNGKIYILLPDGQVFDSTGKRVE